MLRIALARFYVPKIVETPHEALEMLIEDYLLENPGEPENLINFRLNTLWKLEIQDLFKSNLDNCKQLMKEYHHPTKKTFTIADAEDLMCLRLEKLGLEVQLMKYCYGMS